MKANFYSAQYLKAKSTQRLTLASVAGYLRPDSFTRWFWIMLLCTVSSWGGLLIARAPASADILWPANGILLAVLLVLPRRFWTAYLTGSVVSSLLVHKILGFTISFSLIFTGANAVEILVAALWLTPQHRQRPDLTDLKTLGKLLLYGVVLAPLVSALWVEMCLFIWFRPAELLAMSNFVFGDALGIAIMVPLTLAVNRSELASIFSSAKRLETGCILTGIALLSAVVFAQNGLPIVFPLFPLLLLMIFRLGSSGSAIGIFLMCVPAAYFTSQGRGPFALHEIGSTQKTMQIHSIFLLQCFLVVSLVTIYSVAAALAQRDRLEQELTVAYQEADIKAGMDHVTGLANRRAFDKRLALEWRRAIRENVGLSLMMIDVDQFKLYNDHYGHPAGDACLKAVGDILLNSPLRATDLAARYGGEEFAIILPRAGSKGAFLMADRIRQSVADQCFPHLAYQPGIVTISIGVATVHPEPGLNEALLIELADQALYLAKRDGRNQVKAWDGVRPDYDNS
jgi:diguanylate cyclase (GGDEF)-like protein